VGVCSKGRLPTIPIIETEFEVSNSADSDSRDPIKPSQRRQVLLDHVLRVGSAQLDDLATLFGVSRMTIHRDVDWLVEQGVVRKVYGGVTARPSNVVESNFLYRSRMAMHNKELIARAAAELIEPGQAIIIDDSTTTTCLTRFLVQRKPHVVITNSQAVLDQLRDFHEIEVISLGGRYSHRHNAFYGYMCAQAALSLRANTVFMSASTIFGKVAYHQQEDVVNVKRALMSVTDRRILMVDSSKFGMSALTRMADLTEFDLVLTDAGLPSAVAESLIQDGVNLKIVEESRPDAPSDAPATP
jgi:DeoR/GlpR family transcriptional regulator of sugar metabolism